MALEAEQATLEHVVVGFVSLTQLRIIWEEFLIVNLTQLRITWEESLNAGLSSLDCPDGTSVGRLS